MVGTGKFSSNESMKEALEASGSQIVTVALRLSLIHIYTVMILFSSPKIAFVIDTKHITIP